MTAATSLIPARPLAAQAHALRAAAAFTGHAGIAGLSLTIDEHSISIQVPERLAGADARTAAVAVLASAAGGHASAAGRRVSADGELAGHPVHIFTPLAGTP
jgi:hypothetical protein